MRHSVMMAISFLLASGLCAVARADDFRIETKIYKGKEKSPASQNTTLFRGGFVYDYLSGPSERVAVFDPAGGRFVLLDPIHKQKAEVTTQDVLLFAEQCQAVLTKSASAFNKFTADPDFDVDLSEAGKMTLASACMTYQLDTMPANSPDAAQQYHEFCDWYARFNALANPGSIPPFVRMAVNAELGSRGLVPTAVQLTIPAQTGLKAASVRSEHHVTWRLLPRDLERIEETGKQLVNFKIVDFDKLPK